MVEKCIIFMRHAERLDLTQPFRWLLHLGHHWSDTPLTRKGQKLAYQKGIELSQKGWNIRKIYTSPYIRTMATATQIARSFPSSQIIIEPLLAEYQPYYRHFLDLYPEGIPDSESPGQHFRYPEDYAQFGRRVLYTINWILDMDPDNTTTLIITHAEFLKYYLEHLRSSGLNIPEINIEYLSTFSIKYNLIKPPQIIPESFRIE